MRRLAVIVALTLAAGCVTPSIPIPPPDPSEMDFDIATDTDGTSNAVLTYPVDINYSGGFVYVLNHNTELGIFQAVNADDSIGPTQPLAATLGDQVVVSIEAGPQTVSTCVVLQQGHQDPGSYCAF
jgi:hypothetical protein